jgi:hypothetical protein
MTIRVLRRPAELAPWFVGFPFAASALLPWAFASQSAALTGAATAMLATFVIFMPLIAIAGGATSETQDVPLTPRRYGLLLALWLTTDICGMLLAR